MQFNGLKSGLQNVTYCVPQGLILGLKLFLLYINNISNVSSMLDLFYVLMIKVFFQA